MGAVIEEAFAARVARSLASTLHAEHGVAILIGLDGMVTVTSGEAHVRGRVVVVPPHLSYAAASDGPALKILYDPELGPGIARFARRAAGAVALEGALARYLAEATTCHRATLPRPDVLEGLARESGTKLASGEPRGSVLDRRVAHVLDALRDPFEARSAAGLGLPLSAGHLQALFARDIGIPMRTYRLWRRLLLGVTAFARTDATGAAHAAGFADLAHFSRTCRRMLGNSPSELGRSLLT